MGYTLKAFIAAKPVLEILVAKYSQAFMVALEKEKFMLPVTQELFDEMNFPPQAKRISQFIFMNSVIEQNILELIGNVDLAYVEADYWGGMGEQMSIFWRDHRRYSLIKPDMTAINYVLGLLGVEKEDGLDRFDVVDLGRHRSTEDWLAEKLPK